MERKFFNGTNHQLNFYVHDQCDCSDPRKLIVKDGEQPLYTIKAGTKLNFKKGNETIDANKTYPFIVRGAVKFESYDPLPEGYELYVVSSLYRLAVKSSNGDTSRLATVNGLVYSDPRDSRPCGCLGLVIG